MENRYFRKTPFLLAAKSALHISRVSHLRISRLIVHDIPVNQVLFPSLSGIEKVIVCLGSSFEPRPSSSASKVAAAKRLLVSIPFQSLLTKYMYPACRNPIQGDLSYMAKGISKLIDTTAQARLIWQSGQLIPDQGLLGYFGRYLKMHRAL